jgi:hypothetical protein
MDFGTPSNPICGCCGGETDEGNWRDDGTLIEDVICEKCSSIYVYDENLDAYVRRYVSDDCGVKCRFNPEDPDDYQPVEPHCLHCGYAECECSDREEAPWFNESLNDWVRKSCRGDCRSCDAKNIRTGTCGYCGMDLCEECCRPDFFDDCGSECSNDAFDWCCLYCWAELDVSNSIMDLKAKHRRASSKTDDDDEDEDWSEVYQVCAFEDVGGSEGTFYRTYGGGPEGGYVVADTGVLEVSRAWFEPWISKKLSPTTCVILRSQKNTRFHPHDEILVATGKVPKFDFNKYKYKVFQE